MIQLPEGLGLEDEVAINFERDDEHTRIEARLGDACITVESTSEVGASHAVLLVQMLPNIMTVALEAMNAEEAQ